MSFVLCEISANNHWRNYILNFYEHPTQDIRTLNLPCQRDKFSYHYLMIEGYLVILCFNEWQIRFYSLVTLDCVQTILLLAKPECFTIAGAYLLVSFSKTNRLGLWHWQSGHLVRVIETRIDLPYWQLEWSGDDSFFIYSKSTVSEICLNTGLILWTKSISNINGYGIKLKGQLLLFYCNDTLTLLHKNTKESIADITPSCKSTVSEDGSLLLNMALANSNSLQIWRINIDQKTATHVGVFQCAEIIYDMHLTLNQTHLIISGEQSSVLVYNMATQNLEWTARFGQENLQQVLLITNPSDYWKLANHTSFENTSMIWVLLLCQKYLPKIPYEILIYLLTFLQRLDFYLKPITLLDH